MKHIRSFGLCLALTLALSSASFAKPNLTGTWKLDVAKSQFAGIRLSDRKDDFARFLRDLLRIKAEIMCEHFSPQTLMLMSGVPQMSEQEQQQAGEAIALLKHDAMRGFRIDIETDSTVVPDEQAEKEARVEFLTAAGGFLEKALPVMQAVPAAGPLLGELLLFGVRGFRVGRSMEGKFEDALQSMGQQQGPDMQQMQVAQEEIAAEREAISKEKEAQAGERERLRADNYKLAERELKVSADEQLLTIKKQQDGFQEQQKRAAEKQQTDLVGEQSKQLDTAVGSLVEQRDRELEALAKGLGQLVETVQALAQATANVQKRTDELDQKIDGQKVTGLTRRRRGGRLVGFAVKRASGDVDELQANDEDMTVQ